MEKTRKRMSGDERREQILTTACQLFAEYGYDNVSTKQLAAALGCSEALLYKHFPGKEDIMEALYQEWADAQRVPIVLSIIHNSALETLKKYYNEFIVREWDRGIATGLRPLLGKAIFNHPYYKKKSVEVIAKGSDLSRDTIVPVIEFGQSQGEIRQGDAYVMAHLFTTYIAGVHNLKEVFPETFEPLTFEQLEYIFVGK